MTLKFTLGIFFSSLTVIVTLLNVIISVPVYRLAFVDRKSTVYIIAFFNVITDLIQLATTGLFLSASMVADRYLFTGERVNTSSIIIGGLFIGAWFMECLIQIVMAINRFTVITLNKQHIFTYNITLVMFVFLTLITVFSALCTQYLFPCCKFIMDQNLFTFLFDPVEGMYSYSNGMNVSYDVSCTVISTLCYIGVFNSIRKTKVAASSKVLCSKRRQDSRFFLQFVLISVFYDLGWILFETLPLFVPANRGEWFAVVPVLIILNCSTCSIIYLTMNKDVQTSVQVLYLGKTARVQKKSSQVTVTQVFSMH